jgi:hypothetical protein
LWGKLVVDVMVDIGDYISQHSPTRMIFFVISTKGFIQQKTSNPSINPKSYRFWLL